MTETPDYQMDYGRIESAIALVDRVLVSVAQMTIVAQPCKGSLHDLAAGYKDQYG